MNVTNCAIGDPQGIPWKDIHFWRFWQSEKGFLVEKILILNEKNDSIDITFMVAHNVYGPRESLKVVTDSSIGIVGGPWQIPAKGYKEILMPRLFDSLGIRGYYYKILSSSSDKTGLIHIYNPKPKGKFSNEKIITTLGGNAIGNSNGEYWWENNTLFAVSGEKVNIHFSFIPKIIKTKSTKDECYIRVNDPIDSITRGNGKPLKLIKVKNGNLPIKSKIENPDRPNKWKSLYISFPTIADSSEYTDDYSVDFILEAPKVHAPEYHYFASFIMGKYYGSLFYLPLIVLPK